MCSWWSCLGKPQEEIMAAKKEKTLNDLFEDGLKDIYYA
jgi:hypothetical protein